jgi:hypothetical protein
VCGDTPAVFLEEEALISMAEGLREEKRFE